MTTVSYSRNTPLKREAQAYKKSPLSSVSRYSSRNTRSFSSQKNHQGSVSTLSFLDTVLGPIITTLFVLGLATYLYMAVSLVLLTVERKSLQEKIGKATTELSYAQLSYSDAVKKIETKDVYASSFTHSSGGLFATREVTTSLTYKNN